jgi:hypothetical protein
MQQFNSWEQAACLLPVLKTWAPMLAAWGCEPALTLLPLRRVFVSFAPFRKSFVLLRFSLIPPVLLLGAASGRAD